MKLSQISPKFVANMGQQVVTRSGSRDEKYPETAELLMHTWSNVQSCTLLASDERALAQLVIRLLQDDEGYVPSAVTVELIRSLNGKLALCKGSAELTTLL